MDANEYQYLEATLLGRRARDPEYEARLKDVVDPRAAERQRQLDSKSPEEREIELRQYSLRTYGREHMKRYATPIVSKRPLGDLAIEGDQVRDIKGHSGVKAESWRNPDGSLRLQAHSAERQVLKVY